MTKSKSVFRFLFGCAIGIGGVGVVYRYTNPQKMMNVVPEVMSVSKNRREFANTLKHDGKNVVVIGSGIGGICTTYALLQRGYNVVVLEAAPLVGSGCSYALAGGMQRANLKVDANTYRNTVNSLISSSSFKHFHIKWLRSMTDLHFLRWMYEFTWSSLVSRQHDSIQTSMLAFTNDAIDRMFTLLKDTYPHLGKVGHLSEAGALKLHMSEDAHNGSTAVWSSGGTSSEPTELVSRERVFELEPWLNDSPASSRIHGGVLQSSAARANCAEVTHGLADECVKLGAGILCNALVTNFDVNDCNEVVAIETVGAGRLTLPPNTNVVVAAGSWTPKIMRAGLRLYVPVYPLKGYSLLVDIPDDVGSAFAERIVAVGSVYLARYGKQLRVSSIGEFDGWNTSPDPNIVRSLRKEATSLLPHSFAQSIADAPVVCGLRPMTANGSVIIGKAPRYQNVYMNVGPGSNGWKIGAGGGELLARIINEESVDGFDANVMDPTQNGVRYAPISSSLMCNCV